MVPQGSESIPVPFASVLHHRNLLSSPDCSRCHHHIEESLHALRDCPNSRSLWRLIEFNNAEFFSNTSVVNWLRDRINSQHFGLFVAGI